MKKLPGIVQRMLYFLCLYKKYFARSQHAKPVNLTCNAQRVAQIIFEVFHALNFAWSAELFCRLFAYLFASSRKYCHD